MRAAWLLILLAPALPTGAGAFSLTQPIACELGTDCFVQQFVDHDPGPAARDFNCGGLSYDTHMGTDFALPSLAAMQDGVAVLAAAGGQVTALRDGMPDTGLTPETAAEIEGRDCGNGLVIRHGDGWETQYCHLMQGSVAVREGQQVRQGEVLGLVGLSGNTEFPHLHLSLRKDGEVVDPFHPQAGVTCGAPAPDTLWATPIAYQPGAILNTGFATAIPDYAAIKAGTAAVTSLASDAPALVVWGYAFGGLAGDVMQITITGPAGQIITDHRDSLERDQAQFFRAAGRRTPARGWPVGRYTAQVTLIRGTDQISRTSQTLEIE